ncbi:MAG: rhodanese-like domain-containing protein [Pseudomonadota bacterium]|nr:rhodanese-like domain-containing protein [Pseudomonadales bacterium]MDY6920160.1 rhodanese-like domain-containing protein [Pseudomonadota bacterium]
MWKQWLRQSRYILFFSLLSPIMVLADYQGELAQAEAQKWLRQGLITAIDVRTPEEYSQGHVPGAINVPHDRIQQQLDKIEHLKHQPILIYCRSGRRAALAEATLSQLGFETIYHLQGDMNAWKKNRLPVTQ